MFRIYLHVYSMLHFGLLFVTSWGRWLPIITPFLCHEFQMCLLGTPNGQFFLISNKNHINHEEKSKTAKTRCSWWWTQETATKSNKKMKSNLRGNTKGSKKLQSRRTVWRTPSPSPFKKSTLAACNWTNDFSLASKERRFLSIQTTHIKQPGTIFYMLEENFPNKTPNSPLNLAWPIGSQKLVTFAPTKNELQDNVGEDGP